MATVTLSFDIPETRDYDISELRQKLKAYARMLVEMPVLSVAGWKKMRKSGAEFPSPAAVLTRAEAEQYIHSLPIRNGQSVPADVNGVRDLPNPKYM